MEVFIFLGCGILSVFIYIIAYQRLRPVQNITIKTISSTFFVAVGVSAYFRNPDSISYSQWILMGLGCGFLGDIVLACKEIYPLRRHTFVVTGLLLFLIGHVFYLVALAKHLSYHIGLYIAIIILITLIIIIINQMKVKLSFGKTKWVFFLYTLAINTLLVVAILNLFGDWNRYKLLIACGALFFVASDYILSLLYFAKLSSRKRRNLKIMNLLLYYGGQLLTAASILIA
ncbi:MAG: lysoplasmalogenase family protein [Bacilli bacterium]|nr:lysoplasmalogenase family protein [Bacilli bacterium]